MNLRLQPYWGAIESKRVPDMSLMSIVSIIGFRAPPHNAEQK